MAEPVATLKDVVQYLKTDEDGIKGHPLPLTEVKELTDADKLELRHSLDRVRGLA